MPARVFTFRKNRETGGVLHNVLDVLLNVVIIVAAVAVIRTFVVSPFEVEGNSMVPVLEDNEYIIINKIGYILGDGFDVASLKPARGDVVVFRPPSESRKYYVKRIIGLPGEEVVIHDGKVTIARNGEELALDETYLDDRNAGRTFRAPVATGDASEERYSIPEDRYFLLGDNRQGSLDSRSFRNARGEPAPYVDRKDIAGRVWFVALPITKSHALETPEY